MGSTKPKLFCNTAAAAAKSLQSCPTLWNSIDAAAHQAPWSLGFSSKNTGVGCHFLLQFCNTTKSLFTFSTELTFTLTLHIYTLHMVPEQLWVKLLGLNRNQGVAANCTSSHYSSLSHTRSKNSTSANLLSKINKGNLPIWGTYLVILVSYNKIWAFKQN